MIPLIVMVIAFPVLIKVVPQLGCHPDSHLTVQHRPEFIVCTYYRHLGIIEGTLTPSSHTVNSTDI